MKKLIPGFVAIIILSLIACGPVAPVDNAPEDISSNTRFLAPPTAAPSGLPQAEPSPQPTVCVTLEEKDGTVRDICITPSPPLPISKLQMGIEEKLEEAERETGGVVGGSSEPILFYVTVKFEPNLPECEASATDEEYISCIDGFTDPVIDYLKKSEIELRPDPRNKAFLEIWAPSNVIRELAEMGPVSSITPIGKAYTGEELPPCVFDDQGRCKQDVIYSIVP